MNTKACRTGAALVLCVAAVLVLAIGVAGTASSGGKYLACNVWYETPTRIPSALYQKGAMLKAGSEVTNVAVNRGGIAFETVSDGARFRIEWIAKTRPGVSAEAFAAKLVTSKNFSELTHGFSSEELAGVKAGEVRVGMSKAAVQVAVGFPPEIRTPSVDSDNWIYWRDRFRTYAVGFADGKVRELGR